MSSLDNPVYAAILLADRTAAVGLRQRITDGRRLTGAGFETLVGRLNGALAAAATPVGNAVDFGRIIAAMRAAYRPEVVIGAGFSTAVGGDLSIGTQLIAARVVGPGGDPLRMAGAERVPGLRSATLSDNRPGGLADGAVASNAWCYPLAVACAEHEQAAAIVSVISDDPREAISGEASAVLRQRTAAGRAGATLRAVLRRPSSVLELARRKARLWEHQERLADAVAAAVAAMR